MSEKKSIEVLHPSENLVVTESLDIRGKIRKDSMKFHGLVQVPMFAMGTLIAVISPTIGLLEANLMLGGLGFFSSFFATMMTHNDSKGDKVYKELELTKFSAGSKKAAIGQMKKHTRVHLETFSIREASDVEIKELKENTEQVDVAQATHTIKHYIVRDNDGFRLEQECIPNQEAIWDVSADALVEVHKVNETKNRYVFEPVF